MVQHVSYLSTRQLICPSHQSALISEGAVTPDQDISCDCGSEDLDAQDVMDDFLCFFVNICMNQRHIIVTRNTISQG